MPFVKKMPLKQGKNCEYIYFVVDLYGRLLCY